MQNQTDIKDRPPYIRFERRAVEDRDASIKAGHYIAKDVDFVILMRPGSKDTVEKEVSMFLTEWDKRAREDQIPRAWAEDARKGYDFWLRGETLPEKGCPIRGWGLLSPAQQETLIRAEIRTVEDLANLPEAQFATVGIGAMNMKQQAQAWLASAQDTGKLASENAALKLKAEEQAKQLAELSQEFQKLKAQLTKEKA